MRDGERIGQVAHVDHLPAQDLLVVKTKGREVMVPFVQAIVPEVDIEAGTLTVTPPPGLFEELAEAEADGCRGRPTPRPSRRPPRPTREAGGEAPAGIRRATTQPAE